MRFLLDEDVSKAVGHFLREKGHEVTDALDAAGSGASDATNAAWCELNHASVITHNVAHYKPMISRRPSRGHQQYRHVGALFLSCKQTKAVERVRAFLGLVEQEAETLATATDRRVIVEIFDEKCAVLR